MNPDWFPPPPQVHAPLALLGGPGIPGNALRNILTSGPCSEPLASWLRIASGVPGPAENHLEVPLAPQNTPIMTPRTHIIESFSHITSFLSSPSLISSFSLSILPPHSPTLFPPRTLILLPTLYFSGIDNEVSGLSQTTNIQSPGSPKPVLSALMSFWKADSLLGFGI